MRLFALILAAAASLPVCATTLEQLTMDQIVQKSTSIVRGHVSGCAGELWRGAVFTRCDVSITETWKGAAAKSVVVWIPGGQAQGRSQTFSGTPTLTIGQDYVLFLWAGKSGRNQLIGLTQGLFQLKSAGEIAYRAAAAEPMIGRAGQPVDDQAVQYTAAELKRIVAAILARAQQ
jgi:hypothetical protein